MTEGLALMAGWNERERPSCACEHTSITARDGNMIEQIYKLIQHLNSKRSCVLH